MDAEPLLPKTAIGENEFGLPISRTDLGLVPHAFEKKSLIQRFLNKYRTKDNFLPGFFAEIKIDRGRVFGPAGGRMHITLKPNAPMLLNLPDGHKLASLEGLDMLVTLMPIAQPSTYYLRTFSTVTDASSSYPSSLIDLLALCDIPAQWSQLETGRPSACGQFRNRILVASFNRPTHFPPTRASCALHEFNAFGKATGRAFVRNAHRVTLMLCGRDHVACCCVSGTIFIYTEISAISLHAPDDGCYVAGTREYDTSGSLSSWSAPLTLSIHSAGRRITAGCVLHHANMDLIFALDSGGDLSLTVMTKGQCLKSVLNARFFISDVCQMASVCRKLYLCHVDGSLTCINLSQILNGELEYIGQLNRLITIHQSVLSTGLNALAIFASNSFLGLHNEDVEIEAREDLFRPVRSLESRNSNIKVYNYIDNNIKLFIRTYE
jgi:hypothetical protein